MPSGAAARIAGVLSDRRGSVRARRCARVLPQCEFNLGLFQHGVDAAQPIGIAVGQSIEPAQRVVEIGHRFAVGPAPLNFGGQNGVVDGLFGVVAAAEMQCQPLGDFLGAAYIKRLDHLPDAGVKEPAVAFEQAGVGGLLDQRMAEDIGSAFAVGPLVNLSRSSRRRCGAIGSVLCHTASSRR